MSEPDAAGAGDGEPQHVLVAVTGSVAAIKVPELVKQLTLQQESKVMNDLLIDTIYILPSGTVCRSQAWYILKSSVREEVWHVLLVVL